MLQNLFPLLLRTQKRNKDVTCAETICINSTIFLSANLPIFLYTFYLSDCFLDETWESLLEKRFMSVYSE